MYYTRNAASNKLYGAHRLHLWVITKPKHISCKGLSTREVTKDSDNGRSRESNNVFSNEADNLSNTFSTYICVCVPSCLHFCLWKRMCAYAYANRTEDPIWSLTFCLAWNKQLPSSPWPCRLTGMCLCMHTAEVQYLSQSPVQCIACLSACTNCQGCPQSTIN